MKKRRSLKVILTTCFVLLIWAKGQLQLAPYSTYIHQESRCEESSISINHGNSTTITSSFNIIILSSNGSISPLQRLVEVLNDTTYYHQDVKLWIHINENNGNTTSVYNWANNLLSTTVSFNSIHVAKNELHTDVKWLNDTWKPPLDNEHGIILHDSISLSPLWYDWLMHMYSMHDNQDDDIAGYSLERIQTSTHAPEVPFLYSLATGTNAFAIKSSIWRDFIEYSACSLCLGTMNMTSNEEHTQPLWLNYFTNFTEYQKLYFVYEIPKNNKASAMPYDTNSQISTQLVTNINDLQSISASRNCKRFVKNELIRYDHNMNPVIVRQKQSVMVISTAVGDNYREISQFEIFVGSLRKHYKGPISLLISDQASDAVKEYLSSQNVEYETTEEGRSWQDFNVFRFIFYSNACITDVCLVVDFRDVKFQSNPFPSNLFGIEKSNMKDETDLIVFAHNLILHKHQRGGRWFHKHLPDCISFKDDEVPPTTSH